MLVRTIILFALCSLAIGNTWYISPTGNNYNSGTSETSPFLDLQTALLHTVEGDTIIAAPGNYTGVSNVQQTLDGIHLVGYAGSKATIFQGVAIPKYSYIFSLIGNSTIQGVTVSKAITGIAVYSITTTLIDVKVMNMSYTGIVIENGAVNIAMTSMVFIGCPDGIADSDISNVQQILVTQSQFQDCNIGVDIFYTTVLNNLTVDSVQFIGPYGSSGIYVGLQQLSGTITVKNSSFVDFHSGILGTGMYVSAPGGEVFVADCLFQNLRCPNGCGIYLAGDVDLVVENSVFAYNVGSSGTGIYSTSLKPVQVTNSTFRHNYSSCFGAAIYMANLGAFLTTDLCTFDSNTAQLGGGAIASFVSTTVTNCQFTNNSVKKLGGGISTTSALQLSNTTFGGNSAKVGGAVHISSLARVDHCNFYGNTARENGGAIFQTPGSKLYVDNAFMSGNSAIKYGGAVYAEGTFDIFAGVVVGNSAAMGGGLYIDSSPSSIKIQIRYTNIQSNNAKESGGGFACVGNADVFLDEVSFSSNTARNGSAYYCDDCAIDTNHVTIDADNMVSCAS